MHILPVKRRFTRTERCAAIFAVKFVHSVIFLSVAASIMHIFYVGIMNRRYLA